jgi:hypothetical protein
MWTSSQEQLVQKWRDYAKIRSAMHQRTCNVYETGHYILGPLVVILSSVSAVTQFSQLNQSTEATSVSSAVLSVLASILSGLQTFFRFDKTANQHRVVSIKYEALERDMEEQLSTPMESRENSLNYIGRVKKELNALLSSNLSIPQWVVDRYTNDVQSFIVSSQPPQPHLVPPVSTQPLPPIPALSHTEQEEKTETRDRADTGSARDEVSDRVLHQLAKSREDYQLSRLNENV